MGVRVSTDAVALAMEKLRATETEYGTLIWPSIPDCKDYVVSSRPLRLRLPEGCTSWGPCLDTMGRPRRTNRHPVEVG